MVDLQDILKWLDTAGIKYTNSKRQRDLGIALLEEEFDELVDGLNNQVREDILDGMVDLIWIICNNLIFHNITLEELEEYAKNVSESNWSKFCDTEEEAMETVAAYIDGKHPDKPHSKIKCGYKKINDKYVIFREDGKILKSINYKHVDSL